MFIILVEATLVFCGVMICLAAFSVCREAKIGSWKSIAYFNVTAWVAFSTIYFTVQRFLG
ncbi:hypothetical protein [Nitrospina gracilis]|uniref:hypothetical protein n=1 Tax=Nitrospina gracilis TaxID=35801 RepID=UPI001F281963|nr:hypothetical protein [Nitrospina gracilis]MCF8719239.1 hypothetical protein [Nitrospina gracilis Nb-211]